MNFASPFLPDSFAPLTEGARPGSAQPLGVVAGQPFTLDGGHQFSFGAPGGDPSLTPQAAGGEGRPSASTTELPTAEEIRAGAADTGAALQAAAARLGAFQQLQQQQEAGGQGMGPSSQQLPATANPLHSEQRRQALQTSLMGGGGGGAAAAAPLMHGFPSVPNPMASAERGVEWWGATIVAHRKSARLLNGQYQPVILARLPCSCWPSSSVASP